MKITTTVTQEREMDINLPFFRKDNRSNCLSLYAVLDEKTEITIFQGGARYNISTDDPKRYTKEMVEKYLSWEEITEEEFLHVHAEMLKSLSLQPQLV